MTRQAVKLASLKPSSLKIAQPFMAGLNVINLKSSPVGTAENFLSLLTELGNIFILVLQRCRAYGARVAPMAATVVLQPARIPQPLQ